MINIIQRNLINHVTLVSLSIKPTHPCIAHCFGTASDLGLVIEWYFFYQQQKNNNNQFNYDIVWKSLYLNHIRSLSCIFICQNDFAPAVVDDFLNMYIVYCCGIDEGVQYTADHEAPICIIVINFVDGISFEGECLKYGTIVPPNAFMTMFWKEQ